MFAMKRRGRLLALSTAAVALVAVGAAGIVERDRIREEWYIWRLRSVDEETRLHAAEQLGEMRSARAVPELVRMIREEKRECVSEMSTGIERSVLTMTPLAHALYRIGGGALTGLPTEQRELFASIAYGNPSWTLPVERVPYNDEELPDLEEPTDFDEK
jgi:HEAT repeat protein